MKHYIKIDAHSKITHYLFSYPEDVPEGFFEVSECLPVCEIYDSTTGKSFSETELNG